IVLKGDKSGVVLRSKIKITALSLLLGIQIVDFLNPSCGARTSERVKGSELFSDADTVPVPSAQSRPASRTFPFLFLFYSVACVHLFRLSITRSPNLYSLNTSDCSLLLPVSTQR